LARGLETQNVFAERGEKIFRRGFGFDDVFEVGHVLLDWRVIGKRTCLGRQRQKFNSFARGELPQRIQNLSIIHGQVV
jgi:hypothetical protein